MKNKYLLLLTISMLLSLPGRVWSQDDLMDLLESQPSDGKDPDKQRVQSAFKSTRLILGHTTKTRHGGELELLISHRFGRINTGAHELWGLDNSSVRIGLEYGLSDLLNIGIGRSSFDKSYDGFIKYKLLSQSTGKGNAPLSIVLISTLAIKTTPKKEEDPTYDLFKERLAFTYQAVLSKKFNKRLSLLVTPTYVLRNKLDDITDQDKLFAIGVGSRYMISRSVSINLETFQRLNQEANSTEFNAVSVGVDIETGGHVFQLHFTNSQMTFERAFVAETFDDFFDGDIHFGFNISRTFQLRKKNKR